MQYHLDNEEGCGCPGCSLPFANLHNHTTLGSDDSIIKPEAFAERIYDLGQEYVVQTEHGTMNGMIRLAKAAKKFGLKYIPGIEAYLSFNELERSTDDLGKRYYHMLLIAKNNTGLRNLYEIVRLSHLEDHRYYKPRIDWSELQGGLSEGLIATSGCVMSRSSQLVLAGQIDRAMDHVLEARNLFGDDYYLELQDSGADELQDPVNAFCLEASKSYGIPCVATSDAHFIVDGEQETHSLYKRIRTGATSPEMASEYTDSGKLWLKSGQELAAVFGKEAIANTVHIAEQCNVDLGLGGTLFPVPNIPESFQKHKPRHGDERSMAGRYLAHLAHRGLEEAGLYDNSTYISRLSYELDVIEELGFSSYFLIINEILEWCRQYNIPTGPGRGSAAGSMVCYALQITGVDPIANGLFFSRFLNKSRVSWPDIDIDFCQDRRDEVIKHIFDKYREDYVCQIITYGTLHGKGSSRAVGRALGEPSAGNYAANLFPPPVDGHHIPVEEALEIEPRLQNKNLAHIISQVIKLEGLTSHTGIHAAGVVISPVPLADIAPIGRYKKGQSSSYVPAVQMDMNEVEDAGLIKMDILGLRTLTIVDKTCKAVGITPQSIPWDDKQVFDMMMVSSDFGGIFQAESTIGIYKLWKEMAVSSVLEVCALVALFRPGPLRTGMHELYVYNKRNFWRPDPNNPIDAITAETYGCLIYQEQIIELCVKVAGFSEEDGDRIRKVLGKKKPEEVEQWRQPFIDGCRQTSNIAKEHAQELFRTIAEGAAYLFNKSHALSYGLITYWCCYLRYYHRDIFLAKSLNASSSSSLKSKRIQLIKTCQALAVDLLPPRLDSLALECEAAEGGGVLLGTQMCRDLKSGLKQVVNMVRKNKPETLFAFVESLNRTKFNKTKIISLAKTGALDELAAKDNITRSQLPEALAYLYDFFKLHETKAKQLQGWYERKKYREWQDEQKALGQAYNPPLKSVSKQPVLPEVDLTPFQNLPRDPYRESLWEFGVMGACFTDHPLNYIEKEHGQITLSELAGIVGSRNKYRVVGIVSSFKEASNSKRKRFGKFILEDAEHIARITCFSKQYQHIKPKFGEAGKLEDGDVIRATVQVLEKWDDSDDMLELSLVHLEYVKPTDSYRESVERDDYKDSRITLPSKQAAVPLNEKELENSFSKRIVYDLREYTEALLSAPDNSQIQFGRLVVTTGGKKKCPIRWPQPHPQ